MRVNVNAALFPVWPERERLRRLARPEHLAIARLEPVFSRRNQGGFGLDLLFAGGGDITVIPGIRVAHEMLVEPETSALLWPADVAGAVERDTLDAIEEYVLPWLVAQTLARQVNEELIRRFGDGIGEDEFEAARRAHFAGAARYADVVTSASPYLYAQRFAAGASVGILDTRGGTGAAVLARTAASVRADLRSAELNALARRWFAIDAFGETAGSYDAGIGVSGSRAEIAFEERADWREVQVATPVPTEVFLSFDPQDSPPARSFWVMSRERAAVRANPIPECPAVGGSSGRILLLLPSDSLRDRHADGDDAAELARRLRAEGFTVDLANGSQAADPANYDLVHAFSLPHAHEYVDRLRAARARGIPVVATAGLSRGAGESAWGPRIALAVMSRYQDEAARSQHLDLLALRRLGDVNADPRSAEPFPGYRQNITAALGLLDVLLVSGADEEAFARSEYGYRGAAARVEAYLSPGCEAGAIDEIVGNRPFVLCHAPVDGASNQGFLAQAVRRAGAALVVAGPVADSFYFGLLREELGSDVILRPNPAPEEIEALYRRAAVFADVSWAQRSLHRLSRAVHSGCVLVTGEHSYAAGLWPGVQTCDVAAIPEIEAAVRRALSVATPPPAAPYDPQEAFQATVRAYAQAQPARAPA